jgi:hypothetical protein
MNPISTDRYWVLIDNAPVGPLTVEQVHAKLATKEIDWRTLTCVVGGTTWSPLFETPDLGPSVPPAPRLTDIAADPSYRRSYPDPGRGEVVPSIALPGGRFLSLLRSLIIAEACISVVAIGLSILAYAAASAPNAPDAPMSPSEGIACVGFVIYLPGMIAAWIGMCFLRNWSRWLYFVLTIVAHVFSLGSNLIDFSATWHFPDAVGSVASTVGGIVLGLVFMSPLAKEFSRNESDHSRLA